ncbi:hypothetical protein IW140_003170 [Coemansia sp. RSA 1813]|nr:hypothetical protein EV178_003148 [Coemansia sp. RSA 1646]KAJ1773929.1 hypothetical protein LPJ74_000026 [Coemansia sp. RSA 1843]KAJ2089352.1 hypothetical protein IW138_003520 [Coemansia sp. RSA 986]KAJ2214454.1 hypothetical protein EV179_002997 [Coemansia sp. RSA 487]KAJ2569325.1 hypothetical protein IW140_003170 [Coemansia sp. RSA 1813]
MEKVLCSVNKRAAASAAAPSRLLVAQISARHNSVLLNRGSEGPEHTKSRRGTASIFQSAKPPAPVDPRFEVINSACGSLVRAKMPPYSVFYTQVGQTLGQSPKAQTRATTRGTFAIAALKPFLGRSAFVQEITTDESAADVLVAPRSPGDVVIVGTDGGADYFVRRNCLLAQTKFLSISTWNGLGAGFSPLAFDRVGGRGTFVLNAVGGLHRLVLQEGEDYYVDPRYVVAWSSTLSVAPQSGRPQALHPRVDKTDADLKPTGGITAADTYSAASQLVSNNPAVQNSVASPARSPAEPLQTAHISTEPSNKGSSSKAAKVASRILDSTVWPLWRVVKNGARGAVYASVNAIRVSGWAAAKTTKTLAGVPDLYRVTGPGDIYVATRLSPKPWTRISHSIAAKSQA